MADKTPPDYYRILEVSVTASTQQIRDAYKRAALKTHPDRVSADSPERAARTRKFQLVNDAYYTLSDATRRREYDAQRRMYYGSGNSSSGGGRSTYTDHFDDPEESVPPQTGAGGQNPYSWAWNFFTGGNTNSQPNARRERQEAEDEQFGDVFEEMLREEGLAEEGSNRPTSKFWSILGAASGSVIGFIVANMPGAVAGAVAGNRLGAIRDTKGKSVYAVFQDLPQDDRARLLAQLATRVFSHAVGI
ncbi:DnaJ-domain-containing protein [Hypoxylon trugodes]|uniref:DnaJ-domain-containing protein n=1 Tax=Hypoxylon trugodes TaxID=326681 RepID=UPI002197347B|nr:DnaJ-domain-containing protein [Hypoxylon trugodes]KAI1383524.1 DnaJ-domain-containing protein [Hypoxylon trugodes]